MRMVVPHPKWCISKFSGGPIVGECDHCTHEKVEVTMRGATLCIMLILVVGIFAFGGYMAYRGYSAVKAYTDRIEGMADDVGRRR